MPARLRGDCWIWRPEQFRPEGPAELGRCGSRLVGSRARAAGPRTPSDEELIQQGYPWRLYRRYPPAIRPLLRRADLEHSRCNTYPADDSPACIGWTGSCASWNGVAGAGDPNFLCLPKRISIGSDVRAILTTGGDSRAPARHFPNGKSAK